MLCRICPLHADLDGLVREWAPVAQAPKSNATPTSRAAHMIADYWIFRGYGPNR